MQIPAKEPTHSVQATKDWVHDARNATPKGGFPAPTLPNTRNLAPHTQPLEPFFVPKLQNRFADFPNLHYSIRPEAVHLGDLMRLSVRLSPKTNSFAQIFKERPVRTRHLGGRDALPVFWPYLHVK